MKLHENGKRENSSKLARFLVTLCLPLAIVSIVGLAGNTTAMAAPPTNSKSKSEVAAKLPVTIKSQGSSYIVKSVTVGPDGSEHTAIKFTVSGFDSIRLKPDGSPYMIINCFMFTSDGTKYEPVYYIVNSNTHEIIFRFKTLKAPKKILFYTMDDQEKKYVLDWKPA